MPLDKPLLKSHIKPLTNENVFAAVCHDDNETCWLVSHFVMHSDKALYFRRREHKRPILEGPMRESSAISALVISSYVYALLAVLADVACSIY